MKKNILICIIFIFSSSIFSFSQVFPQDSLALVDLYNNCNGVNWLRNTNWLTSSPVSTWEGIKVKNNRVTHIRLYTNNLTGNLPSSLGNITSLEMISVSRNNMTGTIPASFASLVRMKRAYLDGNNFTGSIPSFIGNWSELTELFLSRNNLTGTIPTSLGNLANLKWLWLDDNQLTGNFPTSIMNLTNLAIIGVNRNNLSGTLPNGFGNLPNLRMLFAHENGFSGNIPADLASATSLTELWLHENDFSGNIPTGIDNLPNLLYLGLNDNSLDGTIPDFSLNNKNLEWVFLQNNRFDAIDGITSSSALNHYDLHENLLDFEDLEPIASDLTPIVNYIDQDSIDTHIERFFLHFASVSDRSPSNVYQWTRNGNPISGANNATYTLFWQSGSFSCTITNPQAPNLTIYRRHIDFTSIFGGASASNSASAISLADVVNVNNNPSKDGRYTLVTNKYFDDYLKNSDETLQFYVMDNMGRKIVSKAYNGFNVNQIDISNYPRGMYHLVIEAKDRFVLTKKLVYLK